MSDTERHKILGRHGAYKRACKREARNRWSWLLEFEYWPNYLGAMPEWHEHGGSCPPKAFRQMVYRPRRHGANQLVRMGLRDPEIWDRLPKHRRDYAYLWW